MPPVDQVEKINNKIRNDPSLVVQLDYGTFNKESVQFFKKIAYL